MKLTIILFSLIFILIGIYPFVYNYNIPQIPVIDDRILHTLLVAMGAIQLILLGLKGHRPRID